MKLARYGEPGAERPAMIDADGALRDLGGHVDDITGRAFAEGLFDRLKAIDPADLPLVRGNPRIGPCVGEVANFLAIGLNYSDHAAEANAPIPKEPILFNKVRSCIVGPNDDVVIPPGSVETDWEVELALLIGKSCHMVDREGAAAAIAGYFICNDVSERAYQMRREGQWTKGKCCPTFGPIGPWLVTPDEVGDPQDLALFLDLNGERMQTGNSSKMIFGVIEIVSYLSRFMVLEPGDIITTGTPPGVGMGKTPQRFLRPGDEMRLGIAGLGEQRQRVVAHSG